MIRTSRFASLLLLLSTGALSAQEASHRFDGALHSPAVLVAGAPADSERPAPAAPRAADESAERPAGRSFLSTALHTLGGALVGGWVGYVGSQVALSDWEKTHNGSFTSERSAWVAGGMVVGMIGSRLFGPTRAPVPGGIEVRRARSDRNILDRETIVSSSADNVYELVVTLRRDWLTTRGTNSIRESPQGSGSGFGPGAQITVTPGKETVVVYMDDIRLGHVDEMRKIMTADVQEIEFIEPHEAAYRYGAGHTHGVILLKTSI